MSCLGGKNDESEKIMYQLVIIKILMENGVELILVVEHMVIH